MAYDVQVTGRIGEQLILSANFSASLGTEILSGATFTLLDKSGSVVTGFNGVAVSLVTPGSVAEGSVNYELDTSSLTPDVYYAFFHLKIATSDTLIRYPKPDIQIALWPVVEKIATYDPGNYRGRIRDWLQDKAEIPTSPGTAMGIINPIFSDGDVDNFLSQADSTLSPTGTNALVAFDQRAILLAASIGWEQASGSAALVAIVEKIAIFSDDTNVTYQAMLNYAKYLRMRAGQEVTPTSTDSDHTQPDYAGMTVPYTTSGRIPNTRPMNTW